LRGVLKHQSPIAALISTNERARLVIAADNRHIKRVAFVFQEEAMPVQPAKSLVVASDPQTYITFPVEELLRRLVEGITFSFSDTTSKVIRRSPDVIDEILFETDIDGVHYYVARTQPQHNHQISLSPRELAIARLIAKGLPNTCIGEILDISPWTVATHLRRIFTKLDVTSRAAMVARLGEQNVL
jgi:DNA-binding CsgD family transcriptional regulator